MAIFVTFEGPEGAGKSTQVALLAERLTALDLHVTRTREPGGTPLGQMLRELLLNPPSAITDRAESLLYLAARAQLRAEVIEPALREDGVVLSDRYADSTLAYQGYGRGLPLDELTALVRFAVGDCWPSVTFLLDVPVAVGLERKRLEAKSEAWNRFEAEEMDFHERVREGYRALAGQDPARWVVLGADRSPEELHGQVWDSLLGRWPRLAENPSLASSVPCAEVRD